MSEKGSQEKTERPTDHRLRKLREKGSVAKSRDLPSTGALLGVMLVVWFFWPYFFRHLEDYILMPVEYFQQPFKDALTALVHSTLINFALIMLPILFLAVALAILAHIVQFGVIFSMDPVKPEMKRVNPVEGFKNLFSFSRFMEAIKSIVKTVLMLSALWLVLKAALPTLVNMNHYGLNGALAMSGRMIGQVSVLCIIIFLVLSMFDVYIQKRIFIRENKMSKDEVRREWKEVEGDPQIKNRRKQLFRDLVTSAQIPYRVAKATAVVTNPTHFAVALYYRKDVTDLPVVIAKGMDKMAVQIIAIAKKNNVPVIRNPPVARSLFNTVELHDFINSELVIPVAEILSQCMNNPYDKFDRHGPSAVHADENPLKKPMPTQIYKPRMRKK